MHLIPVELHVVWNWLSTQNVVSVFQSLLRARTHIRMNEAESCHKPHSLPILTRNLQHAMPKLQKRHDTAQHIQTHFSEIASMTQHEIR